MCVVTASFTSASSCRAHSPPTLSPVQLDTGEDNKCQCSSDQYRCEVHTATGPVLLTASILNHSSSASAKTSCGREEGSGCTAGYGASNSRLCRVYFADAVQCKALHGLLIHRTSFVCDRWCVGRNRCTQNCRYFITVNRPSRSVHVLTKVHVSSPQQRPKPVHTRALSSSSKPKQCGMQARNTIVNRTDQ